MDYLNLYSASAMIFFLAGLVQGITGFGSALVAIPLLAFFLDMATAVPLTVLNGLIITTYMAFRLRLDLDRDKLLPLFIGAVPGVVFGVQVLTQVDDRLLENLLGLVLLLFGGYSLAFKAGAEHQRFRLAIPKSFGCLAGFLTGAITAAAGAGGPPTIIYASLTDWRKNQIKATLAGFFAVADYLTLFLHTVHGLVTRQTMLAFLATAPLVLLGTVIGSLLADRIDRRTYLGIVHCGLVAMGLLLLFSS